MVTRYKGRGRPTFHQSRGLNLLVMTKHWARSYVNARLGRFLSTLIKLRVFVGSICAVMMLMRRHCTDTIRSCRAKKSGCKVE